MKELAKVIWLELRYRAKQAYRALTYADYADYIQTFLDAEHQQRKYSDLLKTLQENENK